MNSQNPNKKTTPAHGIRMLRVEATEGSKAGTSTSAVVAATTPSKLRVCVSEEKAALDAAAAVRKKTLRNPLLMQLSALANALDDEVAQILKL
jgi:hypothetical protein